MLVTPQVTLPVEVVDRVTPLKAFSVMDNFHALRDGLNEHSHTGIELSDLAFSPLTQDAIDAHAADTTAVHGIADTSALVLTGDSRLSDQRTPTDGSVTLLKLASGLVIPYSKLNLASSVTVGDLAFDPATQTELNALSTALATSLTTKHIVMSDASPEMFITGSAGSWLMGIDSAATIPNRDLVIAAKRDWPNPGDVNDFIYAAHNGAGPPTLGIGLVPPLSNYTLAVTGHDSGGDGFHALGLRVRSDFPNSRFLAMLDSGDGLPLWSVDNQGWIVGSSKINAAMRLKGFDIGGGRERTLIMAASGGGSNYGFDIISGVLYMRAITGGVDVFSIQNGAKLTIQSGLILIHAGGATPTGGTSGEIKAGTNKLWWNDGGTWKFAPAAGTIAVADLAFDPATQAELDTHAGLGPTGVHGIVADAVAGTASLRTLGTGATQAAAGNDARLSDTRTPTDGSVTDAKVASAAAIAYSKLNLSASIVNADIASGAAISKSKLAALGIVNADVDAAAAIAYSKLSLGGSIVNADIASGAAIAKSKLAALGIVNADVDAAAAIAYSKLNLAGSIVNADIASGAAIAKSKLASLGIVNADVAAGAAIAYSKLALTGSVLVADLAFDPATQAELDTHANLTLTAHGGIAPASTSRNVRPQTHKYVGWTYDPAIPQGTFTPVAGVVYLMKIPVPVTASLAAVDFMVSTAGAGLANVFVGAYSIGATTLTLLATSTNQATAFQSVGTPKSIAVAIGSVTGGDTTYIYAAFVIGSGTTIPVFIAMGTNVARPNVNLVAADGIRFASSGTGQTALPASITMSGMAANAPVWSGVA